MICATQLLAYRTASDDYHDTERLKARFQRLQGERHPFFLTSHEFDEVLRWKLGNQYGRQKGFRKLNTEDVVRTITAAAFSITHPDEEYEVELRLNLLTCIRGVGVPIASALLALVFPQKYAVIDFRTWRQIFGHEKEQFSVSDYIRYLREVRRLAGELGWTPQEVDLAIWAYDRDNAVKAMQGKPAS